MNKVEASKKGALSPLPKVLVSCRGLDGEENVLAVPYYKKAS